jgi:hypothetical protein
VLAFIVSKSSLRWSCCWSRAPFSLAAGH